MQHFQRKSKAGGTEVKRDRCLGVFNQLRVFVMSTNRIEGAAKEAAGSIKEAAGKAVGNERLEAKGIAEKTAGKAQNAVGKAQDKIGNAIKR
jgi:uncharacterized protein YjbJ (UPF0337 family)